MVVRTADLWKSYDDGAVTVLKGIDFACFEGHSVALCGPSGCGKSTLLHLIAGLDTPDRGSAWVNGIEVDRHRDTSWSSPMRRPKATRSSPATA